MEFPAWRYSPIDLLIWFGLLAVFMAAIIWFVYRRGSKRRYEHASRIPLDEEEGPPGRR